MSFSIKRGLDEAPCSASKVPHTEKSIYTDILSQLICGTLRTSDREYKVTRMPMAFGANLQAWKIVGDDSILLKAYHRNCLKEVGADQVREYAKYSFQEYQKLEKLNFPVAKIYNDPVKDNFFIVENIPHAIETTEWEDSEIKFEELSRANQDILLKVQKIFKDAFTQKLELDLTSGNLRMKANGEIVLVDFMETPNDNLEGNLGHSIIDWAQNNQHIKNFLNPGIDFDEISDSDDSNSYDGSSDSSESNSI